ncbi:isoprenylcysteine carboxyl methyltransferase [Psychromonas marina]|uniref:Isoprenylcysteine carboxyl methyltransferase n=1 Tax=Psychromonas marina TaxID=88364 RepID=A0ABQ6DYK5_9GAMM|nr:isoprenylcysteine carboxylmethyltransferase family protein [Psychromonas marina]GLS90030.1 isoprenylcysteine carboxyl methyltransferase [Psychromonas marina]
MVYVIAQFLLLACLAWPIATLHFSILGIVLIVSGTLVAMLALLANRPGNFNVRPIPKTNGELITTGIYYYVRHPMYCSLFFIGLGVVFCQFSLWKLVAWILLVVTLALKARFEERALVLIYSDYKTYQKTTKAFIPLLW